MRGRQRAARAAWNAVALAVLVTVAVVVALPGHPPDRMTAGSSILGADSLVIGVKPDQPGLGLRLPDGTFRGFDVDVARYVAGRLGVPPGRVRFHPTPSSEREEVLRNGIVDLVFATYSITPERQQLVTFAGPYYVARQDILVRGAENEIASVQDLEGRRLCAVDGSHSWRRVTEERGVDARLVPSPSYSACVDLLVRGRVDAVSTDDLILAGFVGADRTDVKMVNAPFTSERYGVGLRKGDVKGCQRVNRILTEMYQSGAAETLLQQWFGSVDLEVVTTVPEFVGCS
ncbi:glutamate ABC transporter substrate-binding protein [Actinomadura sp. NBRC 104412]|uniref:glutamate ABC transporter substrate-binding protein n=1 Tax=Actinomadura sp. NBRC 104412 TaxID=3032203 RepID=UPI0024A567D6|nr:glutamate ABC transporter substrate-binding protein [Actinomadura sp. NBRC 104412]GLZ05610.1 glutamate ABC transporter substrate-binding protein [Actinomadura sp. NBRC 104412]